MPDRERIEAALAAYWGDLWPVQAEHMASEIEDMSCAIAAADAVAPPPAVPPAPFYTIEGLLTERDHYRRLYHENVLKAQQHDAVTRRIAELEDALDNCLSAIETLRLQLECWELKPAVNTKDIEGRARALLSGGDHD
jgi:predicted RNase H-like nuclease (RuvC/YqgF family)